MKRATAILVLVALALSGAAAQSLLDNEYFKKSLELRAMAGTAFEDGDYDAATGYAREAQEYASLSDRYVERMVAMSAADRAIAAAKARAAWAESVKASANFPAETARAAAELQAALAAYGAEDFGEAKARAEASLAALASVTESLPWPATYKVRLIPERRDCLWRIAEYPFIYNDPLKWTVIYEANRKTFRDPNNPNLIFPGQVLQIPSVAGETRAGAWDPARTYQPFPKKTK